MKPPTQRKDRTSADEVVDALAAEVAATGDGHHRLAAAREIAKLREYDENQRSTRTGPEVIAEGRKDRTAAEVLRDVAAADPEAHNKALARGYGVGPGLSDNQTSTTTPVEAAAFAIFGGSVEVWEKLPHVDRLTRAWYLASAERALAAAEPFLNTTAPNTVTLALDHLWGMLTPAQIAELKATAHEVYEACQDNHERVWHS